MRIAAQAFTFRRELESDAAAALAALRRAGYDALELAGYGGRPAGELARALHDAGIEAVAMHVSLDRLRREPETVLEEAALLGIEELVIPSLGGEQPDFGIADYRRIGSELGALARDLRRRGQRLHFHNHAGELREIDGEHPLEILLEAAGDGLGFELDVGWVRVAGEDPLVWLDRLAGRLTLVHLKDVLIAEGRQTFRPLGRGVLDWPSLLAACRDAGVTWGIVEDDDALEGPYDSLYRSRLLLSELGLA